MKHDKSKRLTTDNGSKQKMSIQNPILFDPKNKKNTSFSSSFTNDYPQKDKRNTSQNCKINVKLAETEKIMHEKKTIKLRILDMLILTSLEDLKYIGQGPLLSKKNTLLAENIEETKEKTAELLAKKENYDIVFDKCMNESNEMLKNKTETQARIILKYEHIKLKVSEMEQLNQRMTENNKIKYSITDELNIQSRKLTEVMEMSNAINQTRDQILDATIKNNNIRLECIDKIMGLKPYYKTICLLHDSSDEMIMDEKKTSQSTVFVDTNRKTLIMNHKKDNNPKKNALSDSPIKAFEFEYIISTLNNPFAKQKTLNNNKEFIWSELSHVISSYIQRDNFLFIIFMTDTISLNVNWNVINVLNQHPKLQTTIQPFINQIIMNPIRDIVDKEAVESAFAQYNNLEGIIYTVNDNVKPMIKIIQMNYDSMEVFGIIDMIKDMATKKKKEQSKYKALMSSHYLFSNMIEVDIPFHSLTICDLTINSLKKTQILDFLYKINQ